MSADDITTSEDAVVLEQAVAPDDTVAPPEMPVAETLPPLAPEAIAPEPAPEAKAPPEPEPAPEVKEKTPSEMLMEELNAAKEERERLRELTDRHLARERLQYLRQIGALSNMPDADLLMLAPKADTTTPEGRAQVDAWRQSANVYFENRTLNVPTDPAAIAKGFKESEHGTFNQNTALRILQKMTGGNS